MADEVRQVDTVFLHAAADEYRVAVMREGTRVVTGRLELKETGAGPRPARLRIQQGDGELLRPPEDFVEILRRADRIRISEQTPYRDRERLEALLSGYQLEAAVVRTCRVCAGNGRYAPLTDQTAIRSNDEEICRECALRELRRETAYRGELSDGARDRLEELLLETQDLDRVRNLLGGDLDPELTKFDVIAATTDVVDPVVVSELVVDSRLTATLEDRFETLLPVQSLAVRNGLLEGEDQLVVSATATGKTLVGEIAGLDRLLGGSGKLLFLVPLVALANQKYEDFEAEYGHLADVTLRVGASRIGGGSARFDPTADIIVGTYEGIDHALRTGRDLGAIGTVVIDEVHMLQDEERGHRLDGLIARLKAHTEGRGDDTQWIYLSATVGNPGWLGRQLDATVLEFEERPVPIERHVTFADGHEKPRIANRLVRREFDRVSSKEYRGQTIVFTNSRRRCHELARRLEYDAAAYHAGLDRSRRVRIERQFANQDLAAVVTTAALAAGVDFPASQVIFDSLAMGIEWLTVHEFHQMLGRAGRPDYHDRGLVYLLVEPDGRYHRGMDRTEDEVAFTLLKGEMEDVQAVYSEPIAVEEVLANVVVGGRSAGAITDRMLGDIDTERAIGRLLEYGFLDGFEPTPLGQAVCRHFLSPSMAFAMLEGIEAGRDPWEIVAELELTADE